jgi:hypothetical protein
MVKVFALQPILTPWPGSPVEEFHFIMFHGMQDPDSPTYRRWKTPFLGDSAKPLYIFRSGSRIPDVFEVELNLIVSSAVKEALRPLPSVAFVPVVFSKLIDMPYRAGDFSYRGKPPYSTFQGEVRPWDILDQYPDDRRLHRGVPDFFEVLVPKLSRVRGPKKACKFMQIDCGEKVAINVVELLINASLVEQYPILWCHAHILSEKALELLGPYLDWDYWAFTEFAVD